MNRPPTPPIIHDPIVDEEEEDLFEWYYGVKAGGYVLTFGKFKGRKIHATTLSYLYWCDRTFDSAPRNRPFLAAFHRFHDGLKQYAQTNYGDFIVPFGGKHRGKTIRECHDKPWLTWVDDQLSTKSVMKKKYGVFFTAVKGWLAHPRHQEVKRDVGESLDASEYYDDLNLMGEFDEDYEDDPTESDLEGFVVADDEPIPVEGSEHDSESAQATDECESDSSSDDSSLTEDSSMHLTSEPEVPVKAKNRDGKSTKWRSSRPSNDDFIEDDEEGNESADYEPPATSEPESEDPVESSRRIVNATPRKKGKSHRYESDGYGTPVPSRSTRASTRLVRSERKASTRKMDSETPTRKPRSTSRTAKSNSTTSTSSRRSRSLTKVGIPRQKAVTNRHIKNHTDTTSSSTDSSDIFVTQIPSSHKRSQRHIILSPTPGNSEVEDAEIYELESSPMQTSHKRGMQSAKPSSSEIARSKSEARREDKVVSQVRLINDYFVNSRHVSNAPPEIRHALDIVALWVEQQQHDEESNAVSDSDIEMVDS